MKENKVSFFERDLKNSKRREFRFPPMEPLKPLVKEYMIVHCKEQMKMEVFPNPSISFNHIIKGNIWMIKSDGSKVNLPKATVFGISQKSRQFIFSAQTTLLITIFNPGCASSFIKKSIHNFSDTFLPLDQFFSTQKIVSLNQELQQQPSHIKMLQVLENFLISEKKSKFMDSIIKDSIHRIKEKKGLISIKDLSKEVNISRDSFEKKFRSNVGTTPKQYCKIVRFRSLFEEAHIQKSLTDLGLNVGYYDQSHFIRDFKSFTGIRPSDFFN